MVHGSPFLNVCGVNITNIPGCVKGFLVFSENKVYIRDMDQTLEKQLWPRIKQGEITAYHWMCTAHMGIANKLSKTMCNGHDPDDLLGVAEEALCDSVSTYIEKQPKARFSTHAFIAIRRALRTFLRTDGVVTKTEYKARQYKDFLDKSDKLANQLQRTPSPAEYVHYYGENDPTKMFALSVVPLEELDKSPPVDTALSFDELPESTRYLLEAVTNGSTLGEIEAETGIPRKEMVESLTFL